MRIAISWTKTFHMIAKTINPPHSPKKPCAVNKPTKKVIPAAIAEKKEYFSAITALSSRVFIKLRISFFFELPCDFTRVRLLDFRGIA